jgi:hypothetical protein
MDVRHAVLDSEQITHRIIRNPDYGGLRLSYQGWCSMPVTPAYRKVQFFEALRESVRQEGFRNPIIVWNVQEGLHAQFGVSRLRVAQQLEIPIPCLINDVADGYTDATLVTTENWDEFFTDPPRSVVWGKDGSIDYHYSLERNRRATYDPAGMQWAGEDADFIKTEFSWIDNAQ